MKRFLPWFGIACILIAGLSACDVSGNILSSADKEQLYSAEYRLITADAAAESSASAKVDASPALAEGACLQPGQSFSVYCKSQSSDSAVSAITVTLSGLDADIASVLFLRSGSAAPSSLGALASRELPSVLDRFLPVSLPAGLKPGSYAVKTGFYDKNALVFERSLQIFVLSAAPSVESIQACPASAAPGSIALLQARIGAPADSRPYLVWRYGASVIGAGLLSDGFDQVLWKCPAAEGVYGLKLSVYAFPPDNGLPFSFESPATRSAKVVTALQAVDPNDPFRDPTNFLSLLSFSAGLDDLGYRGSAAKPVLSGKARAAVLGTNFGYVVDADRSVSYQGYLLPAQGGVLGAFSVMGRFMVAKKGAGSLFRSESSEPGFGLELSIDDSGQFILVLSTRTDKAVSESGVYADGRVHDLVVSVDPSEKNCGVQWFLDYRAVSRSELPIALSGMPASGRARLGGEGSAPAVYDAFGVYARPVAADGQGSASATRGWDGAFRTLAARTYARSLVLAEGFEGRTLPEPLKASGEATLGSGALLLGEKSSLTMPLSFTKGDNIQIDIQLRAGSARDYSIVLGPKDAPAVRVKPDGSIQWIDGLGKPAARIDAMNGSSPSIKLEMSQASCSILSGQKRIALFALGEKPASLSLTIDAQSPISVESVLARKLSELELLAERGKAQRRAAIAVNSAAF